MDENPADGVKPDWRAAVPESDRTRHRAMMARAILHNSDTNLPKSAVSIAAQVVEEEFFNEATSQVDYVWRARAFIRSQLALAQAPPKNSTPQMGNLESQYAVRSSSNAGPAAPTNSNPQEGHLDPEQQYPEGVQLNVDSSSAPVDLALRMGLPEQQNLSGRQSDSDSNSAPVDLTPRMGLPEQSHLSGRQCDSARTSAESSSPIPRQQAPWPWSSNLIPPRRARQQRFAVFVPQQKPPWPEYAMILPQPRPEWQWSNLVIGPQQQRPYVLMGVEVLEEEVLGVHPPQQLEWWGMIFPRMDLPREWLCNLLTQQLPEGFLLAVTFPRQTSQQRLWLAMGLPIQELLPQLLDIIPTQQHRLMHALVVFPLQRQQQQQQQLGLLSSPQQPPQQQQPGSGDLGGNFFGKTEIQEQRD